MVKSEVKREVKKERKRERGRVGEGGGREGRREREELYQHGTEFGKWREARLNEENGERKRKRESGSQGRDPLLRGFRRPKSRVPKSTHPLRL